MNTDTVLIVAGMIFAVSAGGLASLFALGRRDDRAARRETSRLR